jgi:H+/Cl- antiporter ClcA
MMVIGIVLAGMTAIFIHQKNYNYYGTMPAHLDFDWVWVAVVVCGVAGGLLGGSFSAVLVWSTARLRPLMRHHSLKVAFFCGLVLATIGSLSGGIVYGTGYIEAKQIVSCSGVQHCEVEVGLAYPFLKILATLASYLSAIPAGIFAPSLATGAGIGHDIATFFPPGLASAVVVLGMVGYFSGVVQTPVTAFVIVMEMTDNQDMVLAMMATSLLASGASKLVCRKPVYNALAENFMRGLLQEKKEKIAGS